MIHHRLRGRCDEQRGFTLIEVLVITIIVGILAAIALAVLLNQEEKGRDSSAKSNVTNLVHLVQACNSGRDPTEDFRDCDTRTDLGEGSIPIDPVAPAEASPDCADTDPGATEAGMARVALAGRECFVAVGESKSGNRFWYVKHDDGSFFRDCTTHGVNGCPSDGSWAG
jgi:prepilin-type N-terminal cleavage/methylation domain-containing protein